MFQFEVIESFCSRNKLSGIDGINGLLGYVKRLISEGTYNNEKPLMKSFGELLFSIWALGKLDRIDIADKIANNLAVGGNFGDNEAYIATTGGNYFRNFELETDVALRLLEKNINFRVGEKSEPDYLIEDQFDFAIEVKAPSSNLALLQSIIHNHVIKCKQYNPFFI